MSDLRGEGRRALVAPAPAVGCTLRKVSRRKLRLRLIHLRRVDGRMLSMRLSLSEVGRSLTSLSERLRHRIVRDRCAADPRLQLHPLRVGVAVSLLSLHLHPGLLRHILQEVHLIDLVLPVEGLAPLAQSEPKADVILPPVPHASQEVDVALVVLRPFDQFELILRFSYSKQLVILVTAMLLLVAPLHDQSQVPVAVAKAVIRELGGLRGVPSLRRVRLLELHGGRRLGL